MFNFLFWTAATPKGLALPKDAAHPRLLSEARSGSVVKISSFGKLSATQRQHLQAYGMLAGRTVQVLSQRPVTIILIEQTELAFETEIARQIMVE